MTSLRITLNNINKQIEKHGYELVKGKGYFHFAALSMYSHLDDSMICTFHMTSYTVNEWEELLLERIQETFPCQ